MSSSCRPSRGADRRPLWAIVCHLLLVAVLAGCGIGAQAHPVPVEPEATGTAGTVGGDVSRPVVVEVFLVRGTHLAPVSRVVSHQPGISASLLALSEPLSETERFRQLRSALPAARQPLTGTILGAVARVSMPAGFDRLSVREQVAATAQIVYTVVANTSARTVQLYEGDRAIPVPGGDGALLDRPVGRADYATWAPLPSPSPVAG